MTEEPKKIGYSLEELVKIVDDEFKKPSLTKQNLSFFFFAYILFVGLMFVFLVTLLNMISPYISSLIPAESASVLLTIVTIISLIFFNSIKSLTIPTVGNKEIVKLNLEKISRKHKIEDEGQIDMLREIIPIKNIEP